MYRKLLKSRELPSSNSLIARITVCAFLLGYIFHRVAENYAAEAPYMKEVGIYILVALILVTSISDMRAKIDRIRLLGRE